MRRKHMKRVRVSTLELTNRLQGMIKKVTTGDADSELKDVIAHLAAELALNTVEIPAELDELSKRLAGEIGGSSIVQDPAWRGVVGAARGQKKA